MSYVAVPANTEKKKGYDKYELEHACRTLEEAAEIRLDKKLMAALQPYLEKKVQAIKSLDDLRAIGDKKSREERAGK